MLKGQVSIEFLASFFLYLMAIVAVFQFISDDIPRFQDSMDQKTLHSEAKYVTDQMFTQSGYHTFGEGGTNWEKNQSTMNSMMNFGLASDYLVVERDKLNSIATVGDSVVNYTQFRNAMELDNQYNFRFVLVPLVETPQTFRRGNPPPAVQEPNAAVYDSADFKVHYGSLKINGDQAYFLVTAQGDDYNTTYVSSSPDFRAATPLGERDTFKVNNREFAVENIQSNRRYDKGSLVVLKREVKQFGSSRDTIETSIKLNRYVSYKAEGSTTQPMRIEVLTW